LEGLKNKHRSGKPAEVSEETSTKIRNELSKITQASFNLILPSISASSLSPCANEFHQAGDET
jgi:hypothetical protein